MWESTFDYESFGNGVVIKFKIMEQEVWKLIYNSKSYMISKVASLFNVSPGNILEIKAGRSWKHLNLDFNN